MMLSEKFVCYHCAGKALGEYVRLYADEGTCSYCHNTESNAVMNIYDLKDCVRTAWSLFYKNADDFYYGSDSGIDDLYLDSNNLIFESPYVQLEDANESFKQDLVYVMIDFAWIELGDFWRNKADLLFLSWKYFCDMVKTKWRYTFFLCNKIEDEGIAISPIKSLSMISEFLESTKELFQKLPPKTKIFRGRKVADVLEAKTAGELGTPKKEKSKQSNRFSPAGIPLFYGSLSPEIVKEEVDGNEKYLVIGEFYNQKVINILDLTKLPEIPSIYLDDKTNIFPLLFLHRFIRDVCKPITSANSELEYVPTQVFTEYLRQTIMKKLNIRGIKYQSSQCADGHNVVLFYENKDCVDKNDINDNEKDCLVLENKTVYIHKPNYREIKSLEEQICHCQYRSSVKKSRCIKK